MKASFRLLLRVSDEKDLSKITVASVNMAYTECGLYMKLCGVQLAIESTAKAVSTCAVRQTVTVYGPRSVRASVSASGRGCGQVVTVCDLTSSSYPPSSGRRAAQSIARIARTSRLIDELRLVVYRVDDCADTRHWRPVLAHTGHSYLVRTLAA